MEIIFEKSNGISICKVSGEIDLYNASELKEAISENVDNDNGNNIIIDFTEILYIDSSGIGALIALMSKLDQAQGKLVLANVNNSIQEVFELTKLTSFFIIKTNMEEAFAFFSNEMDN